MYVVSNNQTFWKFSIVTYLKLYEIIQISTYQLTYHHQILNVPIKVSFPFKLNLR